MRAYRSYENYSERSQCYDDTRVPLGIGLLLKLLEAGGLVLERCRMLDAGCGTGSYLLALEDRVGDRVGLEFDAGMLGRAQRKLASARRVSLHQGSVLAMPFEDSSFDVVVFNQVIHHLDDPGSLDWPGLSQALRESRRVLRPGGAIVINTCSQRQIRDGFWYAPLIPDAIDRLASRYVPVETLLHMLAELGLRVGEPQVPLDEVFFGARYWDPDGPFQQSWRNGDSVWSLTSEEELAAALAELRERYAVGDPQAHVQLHDQARTLVGQATFVSGWYDGD